MLKTDEVVLVLVDVQEKLARVMHDKERLLHNMEVLVKGLRVLDVPIIWMEQNPKGIGPTVPQVAEHLTGNTPISKMSFSCCQNEAFAKALNAINRKDVLIAGIETHICVYQTTAELIDTGYQVHVVADAVSSRVAENNKIGLQKMRDVGASVTSAETVLFELLKVAEGDAFKAMLKVVK